MYGNGTDDAIVLDIERDLLGSCAMYFGIGTHSDNYMHNFLSHWQSRCCENLKKSTVELA